MQQLTLSEAGLTLTRQFEGLRLEAYQDSAGVWTIGYGHTGQEVRRLQRISAAEADTLLRQDLQDAINSVNRLVRIELAQCQFDALVDFCYNVGCGSFERSTLLQAVNRSDFNGAAHQFGAWVHVDMRPVPGLVRRRAAEAALFRGEPLPADAAGRSS